MLYSGTMAACIYSVLSLRFNVLYCARTSIACAKPCTAAGRSSQSSICTQWVGAQLTNNPIYGQLSLQVNLGIGFWLAISGR